MSYFWQSKVILISLMLVSLISCRRTLDAPKIEETIKSGITKQGGTSIKSVICPQNIKPEAGKNFECTGVLDSDTGFTIAVQQQDDQGNIVWEASSVKGLLNMSQLQTEFQQGLKKEIGQASIDCGNSNAYRSVKPGETFDCQLLKRDTAKTPDAKPAETKPEAQSKPSNSTRPNEIIQVTVQPAGDINWQRITNEKDPTVADSKLPTPETPESATSEAPKSEADTPNQAPNSPTAPAAKSPEDFLNQPGAADDFN